MQNNKYYTPTQEELFIGYQCELSLDFFWLDDKGEKKMGQYIAKEITAKVMNDLTRYLQIEGKLPEGSYKTKYLDQSDIESFGWILSEKPHQFKNRQWYYMEEEFEYGDGSTYTLRHQLEYWPDERNRIDISLEEAPSHYGRNFIGPAKSINEFKKIMQYVGIKENHKEGEA